MANGIPSAEHLLAFVADTSKERFEAITQSVLEKTTLSDLLSHVEVWEKDDAAQILWTVWVERDAWWQSRFADDDVLKWLIEAEQSFVRAWKRISRKYRYMMRSQADEIDLQAYAKEIIEGRLRSWGSRVIARGRRWSYDEPLTNRWMKGRASDVNTGVKWLNGVALALYDYLYTDKAAELVKERKLIRAMHAEAIKGLDALDAFMVTYFSKGYDGSDGFWGVSGRGGRQDQIRKAAFEALKEAPLENFYPSRRLDSTARERLLVASLCDLHCKLFRVPKPEAIAEVMTAPFIHNPLDLRTIERLCQSRREAGRALNGSLVSARDKFMDTRQLLR